MSRSRRKNPIIPVTSCRGERRDKQGWHRNWRRSERSALIAASKEELESHLTHVRNEVSDVWTMNEDGRCHWPLKDQVEMSQLHAEFRGRTPREKALLKTRILRKWMAK